MAKATVEKQATRDEVIKGMPTPKELLRKLRANEISRIEAIKLNEILNKEKQAAKERGDAAMLIAVILGQALLKLSPQERLLLGRPK